MEIIHSAAMHPKAKADVLPVAPVAKSRLDHGRNRQRDRVEKLAILSRAAEKITHGDSNSFAWRILPPAPGFKGGVLSG